MNAVSEQADFPEADKRAAVGKLQFKDGNLHSKNNPKRPYTSLQLQSMTYCILEKCLQKFSYDKNENYIRKNIPVSCV